MARRRILQVVVPLVLLVACAEDDSGSSRNPTTTPTPTPTPTQSVPIADLVAVSVDERGCITPFCGPYRFEICVENRGDVDAGEFPLTLAGREVVVVPGLAPSELACYAVAYSWSGGLTGEFEADPERTVPDSNPENNTLTYPEPNPTGCDVFCPEPVPTPERIR